MRESVCVTHTISNGEDCFNVCRLMVAKRITVPVLSVKFIKAKFHNPATDIDFAIEPNHKFPVAVMTGVIRGGDTSKVCVVNFGEVPVQLQNNAWLGTGVEVDEVFLNNEEEETEGSDQVQPGTSPVDQKDVRIRAVSILTHAIWNIKCPSYLPAVYQHCAGWVDREHSYCVSWWCERHRRDFEDMLHSLKVVLGRFRKYGLKLKPSKCKLFRTEVHFLGRMADKHGVRMTNEHIQAVLDWYVPANRKDLEPSRALSIITATIWRP